jgi:outer membrane protein OmpA-like peptidoglycan-associated protein
MSLPVFSQDEMDVDGKSDIELSVNPPRQNNSIDMVNGAALRWRLDVGDVIEIRKKSSQDIKITGEVSPGKFLQSDHIQREILHRLILNTMGIDKVNGFLVEGSFNSQVNYKENQAGLYQEEDHQESNFYIQPRGTFVVPPGNYMPNVRDIPVFPLDRDPNFKNNLLKDGDTWNFPGIEIMRVDELESIPLNATYEYRGSQKVKKNGDVKILHKILYNVEFNHKFKKTSKPENPKQMFGYVTAKLLWDEKAGIPYYMTEDYNLVIMYNNGISHEFKIVSKSSYFKKRKTDMVEKENIRKSLETKLANINETKITVESVKKGISVQIPDVLFNTNESRLTSENADVLHKIGQIIKPYLKNRQMLVRGHTDNIGNDKYNDELSTRRAESVAKYLVDNFEIPTEFLSFEGSGSKFPVSDNSTPAGRKKNRRVEIILLDN